MLRDAQRERFVDAAINIGELDIEIMDGRPKVMGSNQPGA